MSFDRGNEIISEENDCNKSFFELKLHHRYFLTIHKTLIRPNIVKTTVKSYLYNSTVLDLSWKVPKTFHLLHVKIYSLCVYLL